MKSNQYSRPCRGIPAKNSTFRRRFGRRRIAWFHLYGYCSAGLERFCPIERVVCCDFGRELEFIAAQTKIRFLSLEEQTRRRCVIADRSIHSLLPALGSRIQSELTALGGRWTLVCPFACSGLHDLGKEQGWRVISPDPALAADLGDKVRLEQALAELNLPRLRGRWLQLSAARYDELCSEFGARFVLQTRQGSGGSGTAIVGSADELRRAAKRFGRTSVRATPFAGQRSVNINAVATGRGVAVSWPNLQLVGLPELNAQPGQYAGNDYSAVAELPRELIGNVIEQSGRLGRWAAAQGHRGLFGLDFIIEEDTGHAYAVDFNPRWQGSTGLLTQAEVRAGRVPLAALEMAYRFGLLSSSELLRHAGAPHAVEGSQVHVRFAGSNPALMTTGLQPGVVEVSGGLGRRRDGAQLSDVKSSREILVTGAPAAQTLIDPGAVVVRLLDTLASVDARTLRLLPKSRRVVDEIYSRLGLASRAASSASSGTVTDSG